MISRYINVRRSTLFQSYISKDFLFLLLITVLKSSILFSFSFSSASPVCERKVMSPAFKIASILVPDCEIPSISAFAKASPFWE